MKSWKMIVLGAASAVAALAVPVAASADWAASVALTSDYRFRGVSQNSREIAYQGAASYTQDGWYAGVWASKINWDFPIPGNPSIEVDLNAGKHIDLDGTDLNLQAIYYAYPDFKTFGVISKASYFEGMAQLTHSFDPLTFVLTGSWSPEWSLGGGTAWYFSGNVSLPVTDWLSISGTVGHQSVELAPADYVHWDIGATATWGNFVFDARYVDTSISQTTCAIFWMPTNDACAPGFVAMVTYNIAEFP